MADFQVGAAGEPWTGDQVVRLAEKLGSASAKAHDARDALRALNAAAGAPPETPAAELARRLPAPESTPRFTPRSLPDALAPMDASPAPSARSSAASPRGAGDDEETPTSLCSPRVGRVIQRPLPHQRPGLFGMPSHPRGGGGGGGGLANAAKRSGETVMQARAARASAARALPRG